MNITKRIARYNELYNSSKPKSLLCVNLKNSNYPKVDFRDFDFHNQSHHIRYWDLMLDNAYRAVESHEGIEDDWIPGVTVNYGYGSFGGVLCDHELVKTDNTTFLPHGVLKDWEDADQFFYSKDRFWSQIFIESARYISNKANGDLMVEAYPCPSPLDMANLLRGSELFTDYFEYTDQLKSFLLKSVDYIEEIVNDIRDATYNPHGGVFTFSKYIPKGVLLLEDAADLSSPANYLELGKPYTEMVLERFGGGYIHHHSLGRQQMANIDSLINLTVHQISSDPTCIRPITDMDFFLSQTKGGAVLDLEVTLDEIIQYADKLKERRFILLCNCSDEDEAKRAVDFVRNLNQ